MVAACRFDIDAFFIEMKRILKPGGVLAIWTTNRARLEEPAQAAELFNNIVLQALGPHWDPRALIAEQGHQG